MRFYIRVMPFYLLFLVAIASLSSCKTPGTESYANLPEEREEIAVSFDWDKIRERGYITAIMDNSSTGLFLYKGQTMGYEYELLRMFADSLNINLKINITTNLKEAFAQLNKGEGDILAYNLTITRERKEKIAFTNYHNLVSLVLVQRKPENWRELKYHQIESILLRNQVDLIGKEIYVRYHSSHVDRLRNLSDEIGGDIFIIEDFPNIDTEGIIKKVASGEIDYTVAEEDIALVNATYYSILDVNTAVSFPQQIAWGIRKNADSLKYVLDEWIIKMRKLPEYYVVYDKYFRSSRKSLIHKKSEYSSIGGGKISQYDDLIQQAASELGWDWRLLAAQMFQESKFDAKATSWMGAIGLMQVMPITGESYGVIDLKDPEENIKAAVEQLKWLKSLWEKEGIDSVQTIKFVLASYNVGQSHVYDAQRLAARYNEDITDWEIVSQYLIKKSDPDYFNDPVVQFGYCRGSEPVNYVNEIFHIYNNYIEIYRENFKDSVNLN